MFAILLKLTPAFIFAVPGVIALVLFRRHRGTAFVTLLGDLLPEGIPGLCAVGLGRLDHLVR